MCVARASGGARGSALSVSARELGVTADVFREQRGFAEQAAAYLAWEHR